MKRNLPFVLLAALLIFCAGKPATAQALLSLNKTAVASSSEASYPASNAVDASGTTFWSSSSTNYIQTLQVDLLAPADIDYVEIKFADGRYAVTFDIQGSANGSTWVTMYTVPPGNTLSALKLTKIYGTYRYVRFQGRGRANSAGYRIADFKVYGHGSPTTTQQNDINTLTNRLIASYVWQETDDLSLLLTTMQANGKWPDSGPGGMNYSGNAWTSHTLRLHRLARAYRNPANVLYNNPDVPVKFMRGMRYFIGANYVSTNWHDNEIRSPNNVVAGLLLMKGAIPADSLLAYASTIIDYTNDPGYKGCNLAWASLTKIRKGLVMDRYTTAYQGFESMARGLNVESMSYSEGIKLDNSFHQHRSQLQSGSYGSAFLIEEVKYLHESAGTGFNAAYTTTQRNNLRDVMLGGLHLLSYRNAIDFGALGRALSNPNATRNISAGLLDTQAVNDPTNSSAYMAWKANLTGAAFPVIRAKYFWNSNIITSHGANFYLSAKIASSRNKGTESLGSNLKGWNLPFGATNIMTTGTEYENIFAAWNWSRIPGTTAEMSEAAASTTFGTDSGYVTAPNSYGGGVSVNESGAIAFPLDNKRGVTGKKAYFFVNNMMVCLGSSINASKSNPIVTTVNQTKSTGSITYNNASTTLSGDSLTSSSVNWVNHNNVGYVFPSGGSLSITNKTQSGTWASLGGGTGSVSTPIFNLYFRHSNTPVNASYYYIVAPNKQASDMATLASSHGVVLVSNTSNIQAIQYNGTYPDHAVVFYAAGQVTMPDGLVIKSNKAAVVFVREYSSNYRISVGDPLFTGSPIVITVNQDLSGSGTVPGSGETAITFSTYSGDDRGKTNTGFFNKNSGSLMAKQPAATDSTTLADLPGSALRTNSALNTGDSTEGVVVYPNPTTSTLKVSGVSSTAKIEVYNSLSGLKYKTVTGNSVDVSELQPATTYFLRITDHGKVIYRKFIKE